MAVVAAASSVRQAIRSLKSMNCRGQGRDSLREAGRWAIRRVLEGHMRKLRTRYLGDIEEQGLEGLINVLQTVFPGLSIRRCCARKTRKITRRKAMRWTAKMSDRRGATASRRHILCAAALLCLSALWAHPGHVSAGSGAVGPVTEAPPTYDAPLYPDGTYDPAVPAPSQYLGAPVARSPVRYDDLIGYLKQLSGASPLVDMVEYGRTHEGRTLYYLIVSSRDNMARLDEIKGSLRRLAHTNEIRGDRELEALIARTPAVAWMAYSIHGDELSSTDAAVQLAYQLAAGTDSLTESLRHRLVVIIDPLQNPDGRERFLAMMEQVEGVRPNWDTQSFEHTGFWSGGRGNHYLFDLNRDWYIQIHPETKGKVEAIVEWNPQLFVDSHEMGAFDTYLFSPPREPFNPNMTPRMKKWWKAFAEDQARAFDRYGWSYYTREWNEEWFPGYGSSWSLYLGALGILYEQAGVEGSLIKRHDGSFLTYGETVHHQFISSMANLQTAAKNKDELLRDYYLEKSRSSKGRLGSQEKAFVLVPGDKPGRVDQLVASLLRQGIEVRTAQGAVKTRGLADYWGESYGSKTLAPGSYVVPLAQPMGLLAKTLLEFDPRMTTSSLEEERYELEKNKRSRIYDVTAWSLPIAAGIECYSSSSDVRGDLEHATAPEQKPGRVRGDGAYGYLIDGRRDKALSAATALMEAGCSVRHATKPFRAAGVDFVRGSFLLRGVENPEDLHSILERVCEETGVDAIGAASALSQEGPDLGARRFQLLKAPRVCLLGGSPISSSSYGAIWFMLDHVLGTRSSRLDIGRLHRAELDKYNVIIMPDSWGRAYGEVLGRGGVRKLKRWIEDGGTLIAMGSAATALADTSLGLGTVRLRRQAINKLDEYEDALKMEPVEPAPIDSLEIWEWSPREKEADEGGEKGEKAAKKSSQELKAEDEMLRLFRPQGAMLRVDLDQEHWLASGSGDKVPAVLFSRSAFMSKPPVETVGRLAEKAEMRVSGLLWPEARTRWAKTAYLTRESVGEGQIILFLNDPYFRAQYLGTGRLLMNAIVLGPGMGTHTSQPW